MTDPARFRLYCAVCLYARSGTAEDADTIIEGVAVCYDHMSYISSTKLSNAVQLVRLHEANTPPRADE
jgi:hypothetical protein